jgi:hypothetical protein
LHDLLDRVERQHRISKANTLREAGIGAPGDSTKHLSQYAISRDLPDEEIQRRSARLRKGTRPYEKIARAAARLAGLAEDDRLVEVFGQANFWRGDVFEAAPEFVELARRLRFVADAISTKYNLTTFFREVEKAGVSPALKGSGQEEQIEFSSDNRMTDGASNTDELGWPIELYQPTYLSYYEQLGDLPAYPLVVLGAWALFDRPFQVEVSSVSNASGARTGWPAVVLSFCIAPVGGERSATPVLRVDLRALVDLRPLVDLARIGFRAWVKFSSGHHTDGDHKIIIKDLPELPPPFTSDFAKRHTFEVIFLPINSTVCEAWFKFCAFENEYYDYAVFLPMLNASLPVPHPAQDTDDSLCTMYGQQAPFSSFGSGTLAGLIDAALCDPTRGLDQLLEQQVKRLTDAFGASQAAERKRRDRNWRIIEKRWSTPPINSGDGEPAEESGKLQANGDADA